MTRQYDWWYRPDGKIVVKSGPSAEYVRYIPGMFSQVGAVVTTKGVTVSSCRAKNHRSVMKNLQRASLSTSIVGCVNSGYGWVLGETFTELYRSARYRHERERLSELTGVPGVVTRVYRTHGSSAYEAKNRLKLVKKIQ